MSNRRSGFAQATLKGRVTLSGVGVHSGQAVSVTLHPAEPNSGISFLQVDRRTGREYEIHADFRHVAATELSTTVARNGASVATIEHLMATFAGLGIDNAVVEIDGPEVPVMDGSAAPFVEAIAQVGIRRQGAPRRYIRVKKPIRVESGDGFGELRPYDGLRLEIEIDFAASPIGRQRLGLDLDEGTFRHELGRARTFGFLADVEKLWSKGLALGASLENAVVIGDSRVINPEGLRFDDEFVRHKALDALGDLALAGRPLLARYRSYRGGHALNFRMLEALFADASAFEVVEAPVRVEAGHGELPAGVVAPAYGPDVS